MVVDEGKTSSGGMFSPRKRCSLASFLRFASKDRSQGECEDGVESMLKHEEVGERDFESIMAAGFDGFILVVRGTGSDRS